MKPIVIVNKVKREKPESTVTTVLIIQKKVIWTVEAGIV